MHDEDLIPTKSGFFKWGLVAIALVVVAGIIFAVLGAAGVIFQTEVERRTFERSYQKKAGDKQKIATYEAQLAEIESQLSDPKLDATTKRNLRAQRAAIRVRIRAARSQQHR